MNIVYGFILTILSIFFASLDHNDKLKYKGIRYLPHGETKFRAFGIIIVLVITIGLVFSSSFNFASEEFYISLAVILLLITLSLVDIYDKEVPDQYILFYLLLLLPLRYFFPLTVFIDHIIGGIVGFGFFYIIALIGEKVYKKESLGGGDIKLYGIIGLILGVELTIFSIFVASLTGLLFSLIFIRGKEGKYLPFVPFISLGVWIAYIYGNGMLDWYFSLFWR